MMQRPPGVFFDDMEYPEEWGPMDDRIADRGGGDGLEPPKAAECPIGDMEYPEDWGPMDDGIADGGGGDGLEPQAAATGGERVPVAPPDRPSVQGLEPLPAAGASTGSTDMRRNPLAPPRVGSAFRGRTHYPRRDPRHTGPRLLHAGGIEICRGFNRGSCGGPGGPACRHGRAHACSQCGRPHPVTTCTTPEADWPEKEGALV